MNLASGFNGVIPSYHENNNEVRACDIPFSIGLLSSAIGGLIGSYTSNNDINETLIATLAGIPVYVAGKVMQHVSEYCKDRKRLHSKVAMSPV